MLNLVTWESSFCVKVKKSPDSPKSKNPLKTQLAYILMAKGTDSKWKTMFIICKIVSTWVATVNSFFLAQLQTCCYHCLVFNRSVFFSNCLVSGSVLGTKERGLKKGKIYIRQALFYSSMNKHSKKDWSCLGMSCLPLCYKVSDEIGELTAVGDEPDNFFKFCRTFKLFASLL